MSGGKDGADLPEIPNPVAIPEAPKVPKLEAPKPVDIISNTEDRRQISRSKASVNRQRLSGMSQDEVNLVDVKNLLGS